MDFFEWHRFQLYCYKLKELKGKQLAVYSISARLNLQRKVELTDRYLDIASNALGN